MTEPPGLDFYESFTMVKSPIETMDFSFIEKKAKAMFSELENQLNAGKCSVYGTQKPE